MEEKRRELVHKGFELGILFKFIDGILELIGGIGLLLVSPRALSGIVGYITRHELSEDPHDLIANFLVRAAAHFSVSSQLFGSFYLLSHGVVKIVLVLSLWKRKLWSYPAAIVFFFAFIVYQMYRYTYSHSAFLVLLSILDVVVIVLTWLEYKNLKKGYI